MKYLVSCLLALPFITSCVVQEEYYERNYYSPVPQVEVPRFHTHHQNNNTYYRPSPRGRVYHGHTEVTRNRVSVNPRVPRAHVEVQQNVHGHGGTSANLNRHVHSSGVPVVVQNKVHGHNNSNGTSKSQRSIQSHSEAQNTTHGHN